MSTHRIRGPREDARVVFYQPGFGPIVDLDELAEVSADLRDIEFELLLVKRDLAWNRVIDDAIVVCLLLGELEAETARKPRRPAARAGRECRWRAMDRRRRW